MRLTTAGASTRRPRGRTDRPSPQLPARTRPAAQAPKNVMTLNQSPFTAAGNLTRDPELRSVRRLQARARTIRHGRRRGGGAANGWVELLRRGRAELWAPFHRATRRLVPAVPEALALLWAAFRRPGPDRAARARSARPPGSGKRRTGWPSSVAAGHLGPDLCGPAAIRVEHLTRPGFDISMMGGVPAVSWCR